MSSAVCFNLDQSKILSSGNELKVAKMNEFIHYRAENNVRKEENAGYHHFLPFPRCFQKGSFQGRYNLEYFYSFSPYILILTH